MRVGSEEDNRGEARLWRGGPEAWDGQPYNPMLIRCLFLWSLTLENISAGGQCTENYSSDNVCWKGSLGESLRVEVSLRTFQGT